MAWRFPHSLCTSWKRLVSEAGLAAVEKISRSENALPKLPKLRKTGISAVLAVFSGAQKLIFAAPSSQPIDSSRSLMAGTGRGLHGRASLLHRGGFHAWPRGKPCAPPSLHIQRAFASGEGWCGRGGKGIGLGRWGRGAGGSAGSACCFSRRVCTVGVHGPIARRKGG